LCKNVTVARQIGQIRLTFSEAVLRQTKSIFKNNIKELNRSKIFGDLLPNEFGLLLATTDSRLIYKRFSQNCLKRLLGLSPLSVCKQGTTRIPLDGFPYNLFFVYFWKFCEKNSISLKTDTNNGTLCEN